MQEAEEGEDTGSAGEGPGRDTMPERLDRKRGLCLMC